MTRGSFFVTTGGSASVIDSDDSNASATSSVGRLLFAFFRSGDMGGLVEVPWLFDLRALSDMELGGMNALRLDDDSALRGSRMESRLEVRSNQLGGGVSSLVPRTDVGPRRFLVSFSSCTHHPSILSLVHMSPGSYHLNVFGRPPGLPRAIFPRSTLSIHKTGEMGHSSAEQRLVTVSTLEYAHDSTVGPLIGKCTDIPREVIEERGWDLPIVP
jgi:hypothetical protein